MQDITVVMSTVTALQAICDVTGYFHHNFEWTYSDVHGNNRVTLTNGVPLEIDGQRSDVLVTESEPSLCRTISELGVSGRGVIHSGIYECGVTAGNREVEDSFCYEPGERGQVDDRPVPHPRHPHHPVHTPPSPTLHTRIP